MTSGTKNNSITSFYLFSDYDVTRSTPPYFILDYDVILFYGVNPIVTSLCPCVPVPKKSLFYFYTMMSSFLMTSTLKLLRRHCVPVSLLVNCVFPTTFNQRNLDEEISAKYIKLLLRLVTSNF